MTAGPSAPRRWRRLLWSSTDAPSALLTRRLAAFAVAFGLLMLYAMRGGAYGEVPRHEIALGIWLGLAVGFAFGVFPRSRWTRAVWVPMIAVAGFAVLNLLSVAWTSSDGRTIEEFARTIHYSGVVLLPLVALSRHTWRSAAAGLTAAAVAVCLIALAARMEVGGLTDEVARFFDISRLSYPLDYWNATAAWAAMALTGALAWSAHARQPVIRALALAAVPTAGVVVYLSYSRAGVAGAVVGVLSVIALSRNRWTVGLNALTAAAAVAVTILVIRTHPAIADGSGTAGSSAVLGALALGVVACALVAIGGSAFRLDGVRMPRRAAFGTAAVAGVVAIVAGLALARGPGGEAWTEFTSQRAVVEGADPAARLTAAGGTRYEIWGAALDAFRADPVAGIGPGTFEFHWTASGAGSEFVRDAHSLYLEQLAELGMVGFLSLGVWLLGTLTIAVRTRLRMTRSVEAGASAAMISTLIVFLVHAGVDWMWELTAVGALGLGAGGVALAGSLRSRRGGPLAPGYRVAVVACCLLAALIQLPGLVSASRSDASQAALASGDGLTALTLADEAVEAEPWAADPYVRRAAARAALGRYPAARADLRSAIAREPLNWRHRLLLARLELRQGNQAAAVASFERAEELNPTSTLLPSLTEFRDLRDDGH